MRSLKWASELLAGMLLFLSVPAHAQLFSTSGSFAVSEDGAATYNVPIQVPPGVAGMEPKLALSYNSQSGNGLLGVGWSLSGMSAITRCPRTLAQDNVRGSVNFDSNDRYCLDGQRLIAISGADGGNGTEYRTERESFSKINSYGTAGSGPAYFIVKTKAGMTMEYGNTADSRIGAVRAPGSIAGWPTGTAAAWAQNRMRDTKGNYIDWVYTQDSVNGQWYPQQVQYTGNTSGSAPLEKISFLYEDRADVVPQYHAGSLIKYTKRLSKVQTYSGVPLVSEYQLTYAASTGSGGSLLSTVAKCAPTSCLSPLSLTWLPDIAGSQPLSTTNAALSANWINQAGVYAVTGDFNGDGKTDVLLYSSSFGASTPVMLSNGDGSFTITNAAISASWINQTGTTVTAGDFNGDGKTDLLLSNPYFSATAPIMFSNGDGTFNITNMAISANWIDQSGVYKIVGDFNGDGRTDILLYSSLFGSTTPIMFSNGDGSFTITNAAISANWINQAGVTVTAGDFNGDGKMDVLLSSSSFASSPVMFSNGDGTFAITNVTPSANWINETGVYSVVGDFNGDGKTDVLLYSSLFGSTTPVMFSNGDGTFTISNAAISANWINQAGTIVTVGDFNGDGKADVLLSSQYFGTSVPIMSSNGDGSFSIATATVSADWINEPGMGLSVGDFNGDGKADILLSSQYFGGTTPVLFSNSNGSKQVSAFQEAGIGKTISPTYNTLSQALGTQYLKEFSVSYPQSVITSPLQVVTDVGASNGIGGMRHTTYWYGTALADATGRGYLGFNWVQSQDTGTGLVSRTTYHQDFPYVGVPSATASWTAASQFLSKAFPTYVCTDPFTGTACVVAPGKVYSILNTQTDQQSWDLNGVQLPTMRTTQQYDLFGNATQVKTETLTPAGASTGYSKTTTNTYYNDTTNWYLGRLLRATTTSVAP